jgi:threonine-phosphate decarboxylase
VPAVVHGGLPHDELDALGIDPDWVLDFSVSLNPLGPSPRVLEAARAADLITYPDPACGALRERLAECHAVGVSQVMVGNGASELIWLAVLANLRRDDTALVVGPTYGEYARSVRLVGGRVVEYLALERDDFAPDLEAVERLAARTRPSLVFVCNPNNPTGTALDLEALERLARLPGEPLVLVDEAFVSLARGVDPSVPLLEARANLLIVRSLTKDHAIAGLRLGYALGAPDLIARIRALAPPWSVNAAAQAAGLAALGDPRHLEAGLGLIAEVEAFLRPELGAFGLTLRPSASGFWLVRVPDAARLRQELLGERVLVRDCASFGLPRHIRIGARPLADCARLVEALARAPSLRSLEAESRRRLRTWPGKVW